MDYVKYYPYYWRLFYFNEILYFDLWKSNQVEAFINTIQIDGFFNNDNAAVRASIVSNGAFYLSFYNH